MKKFNILFLALLLLSSILHADDDKLYSFIGVQTSTSDYEATTPTLGIKYGKQSKNVRTSIAYNYGEESSNQYHSLLMQVDTGVLTNTFKEIPIKPYIGASFGVMQHDYNSRNDRGYLYGANAGLTYLLNDVVDLDLAYRFMKTSKLENINEINEFTFSMHYFY